jgi:hypothetical protein
MSGIKKKWESEEYMRALILLVFSLNALSCHSLGFNENKESYYHWRVKRTYDQIFEETEVRS